MTARVLLAWAVLAVLPRAGGAADLSLDQYRGKVLVLNFWASWCAPGRKEMPLLVRMQTEYGPRGVQVLGLSIDEAEDRESAGEFARKVPVNYAVRYGHTTEDMKPLGLATAIPATAIFDRDGKRLFRIIGELSLTRRSLANVRVLNETRSRPAIMLGTSRSPRNRCVRRPSPTGSGCG